MHYRVLSSLFDIHILKSKGNEWYDPDEHQEEFLKFSKEFLI